MDAAGAGGIELIDARAGGTMRGPAPGLPYGSVLATVRPGMDPGGAGTAPGVESVGRGKPPSGVFVVS